MLECVNIESMKSSKQLERYFKGVANHQRITILSKGEREPAVKGKGIKANEPNRRVEIKVTLSEDDKEIRGK